MKRNKKRADAVIAWIERLRVTTGKGVGGTFKLRPWQKRFLRDIYEPVEQDGSRHVRRAILSMGRKNGKSELSGALALVHLIGPEAEPNGEVVLAANSKEQAAIVFKVVERQIKANPALAELVGVAPSTKRVWVKRSDLRASGSVLKTLAADAHTAHGLNPTLIIYDELAQAKSREFFDTLATAQGARENPLFLTISTQNNDPQHPLSEMIDDALSGADTRTVCHLYAANDDCGIADEAQWHRANPALGDFRDLVEFRMMAERAARLPSEEASFRLLYLNQRVSLNASLITRADWKACEGEATIRPGEPIILGLDLSKRTDLTALVATSVNDGSRVTAWFFKPKDYVEEHTRRDRVRYDLYAAQGYLDLIDGRAIDPESVARKVADLCSTYDVRALVYDRYGVDELLRAFDHIGLEAQRGEGSGLRLEPWGQGYRDMSPAVDAFEQEVLQGTLKHPGNPLLTWCTMNAQTLSDPAGNRKLDKSASRFRIDGAVALAMALGFKARDRDTSPVIINPWENPDFKLVA